MKTSGWVCIIIGGLSFVGAAIKGDSVMGPVFLVGLGVFLVHQASQKKQEQKDKEDWMQKDG